MKPAVFLVAIVLTSSLTYAQSATEKEVMQTIIDGNEYLRTNLKSRPDDYSQHGALEFWSSGGLVNEISPDGRPDEYDAANVQAKHIQVITLVEGQAAVAVFYSEGSMKPKGSPAVNHYLTRVTQVFVKEDGKWKIRASHWSPVTGGSGTSQAALEQ